MVQLVGRFDTSDPAGEKFDWPGTTIRAKFEGSSASVKIRSLQGQNWFEVIIDGIVAEPLCVSTTSDFLEINNDLPFGIHTIELVKRTEASQGSVQFGGFDFGNAKSLAPPTLKPRKIEFIGDSITCGYGNDIEPQSSFIPFNPANENNYKAFGSIAARILGAEQISIAKSGIGLLDTPLVNGGMFEYYSRTICRVNNSNWDFQMWVPDVVVINLGTNDLKASPMPEKTLLKAAYSELITFVRMNYPGAEIFCVIGPRLSIAGEVLSNEFVNEVIAEQALSGETKLHFLKFPVQDVAANGVGEENHPSLITHQLMGEQLAAEISAIMGWEQ